MGLFKDIGGGIKSGWRGITGQTAAKETRRAGERQAGAIEAGLAAQQAQVPVALREISMAGEAGRYYDPYRVAGARALQQMGGLAEQPVMPTAAEVAGSPAVQFQLEQAQRAAEMGAAARGGLFGGGHQRELARYMQGVASQEYGAEAQRQLQERQLQLQALQGISGMGFGAVQDLAGIRERIAQQRAGVRTGSGAAQAASLQAAGQARASGALAGAQAKQQAIGGLMKAGGMIGSAILGGPMGAAIGGKMMGGIGGGAQ